jgi:hypothetical protein
MHGRDPREGIGKLIENFADGNISAQPRSEHSNRRDILPDLFSDVVSAPRVCSLGTLACNDSRVNSRERKDNGAEEYCADEIRAG